MFSTPPQFFILRIQTCNLNKLKSYWKKNPIHLQTIIFRTCVPILLVFEDEKKVETSQETLNILKKNIKFIVVLRTLISFEFLTTLICTSSSKPEIPSAMWIPYWAENIYVYGKYIEIYILPYKNAHMEYQALSYHRYISFFFSWKLLHLSLREGWTHTKDYKMQELPSLRAQIPWMHSEATCDSFFTHLHFCFLKSSGWERHNLPVEPTQRLWLLLEILSLFSIALGDHVQLLI